MGKRRSFREREMRNRESGARCIMARLEERKPESGSRMTSMVYSDQVEGW